MNAIDLEPEAFGEHIRLHTGGSGFIIETADGLEIMLEDQQATKLLGHLSIYLADREDLPFRRYDFPMPDNEPPLWARVAVHAVYWGVVFLIAATIWRLIV